MHVAVRRRCASPAPAEDRARLPLGACMDCTHGLDWTARTAPHGPTCSSQGSGRRSGRVGVSTGGRKARALRGGHLGPWGMFCIAVLDLWYKSTSQLRTTLASLHLQTPWAKPGPSSAARLGPWRSILALAPPSNSPEGCYCRRGRSGRRWAALIARTSATCFVASASRSVPSSRSLTASREPLCPQTRSQAASRRGPCRTRVVVRAEQATMCARAEATNPGPPLSHAHAPCFPPHSLLAFLPPPQPHDWQAVQPAAYGRRGGAVPLPSLLLSGRQERELR
jgi:hypothetical protein